jgi:hypothetical protein
MSASRCRSIVHSQRRDAAADRLCHLDRGDGRRCSPPGISPAPDDHPPGGLIELMAQGYAAVHGYQDPWRANPQHRLPCGGHGAVVHGTARIGDRLLVSVQQTALVQPFIRAGPRSSKRLASRRGS